MKRAAGLGAGVGSALGLVFSVLIGLVVVGTDDIPDIIDAEQLPALYAILAVLGAIVGAATGAIVATVAVGTARSATGDSAARRLKGALAAGAVSAVLSLFLSPIGPVLAVAVVVGAVVGGGLAWIVLPRLVDLDAPVLRRADPRTPGQYGRDPVAHPRRPRQLSTPRRVAVTVLAAVAGGFVGTNVVMAIATAVTSLSADVEGTIAAAVLAVLVVAIGTLIWRRTGPART